MFLLVCMAGVMLSCAPVEAPSENDGQVSQTPAEPEQPDLFTDEAALAERQAAEEAERDREKRLQNAILDIKHKLGKNAILKGMNLLDGATAKERNQQVGGHKE